MTAYHLALMGDPSDAQRDEVTNMLSELLNPFGLHLGDEVELAIDPTNFDPPQQASAAAAFFGSTGALSSGVEPLLKRGIPILPISSLYSQVSVEIPSSLRGLNCLSYNEDGLRRVATALLECVGLLPHQRRVFVSYRRDEARAVALQLFDALSARRFDVFLDTHGVPPAEDFQAVLWHRLCDCDVLVMLDTPTYFDSRWTKAEFGRALAKNISILRVGWPGIAASKRAATATSVTLNAGDIDSVTDQLGDAAIDDICDRVEAARSKSFAVRSLNIFSKIRQGIECIGGNVVGVGPHRIIHASVDDEDIMIYPTIGVPTAETLHDAALSTTPPTLPIPSIQPASTASPALVYDHIGFHPRWQKHLDWLGEQISSVRWVRADEVAWDLADWK